jgi:SAM-dependent methyltransferase
MFTLDEVVPWGRSFQEYRQMFALSDADLASRIVDCGGGPASFNAEAARRGARVVSCDPLYRWGSGDIQLRIAATYDTMLEQTRRNRDEFVWNAFASVDDLGGARMAAMNRFLGDYETGKAEGRYIDGGLPALPFPDGSFDLALCSHLLFLYSAQLDVAFHRLAVRDMCRVATEVRIFPLLELGGARSPYIEVIADDLTHDGMAVTIEHVPYEFRRDANQMMRIRRRAIA